MDHKETGLDDTAEVEPGFASFLVQVATFLTLVTVERLAHVFNYSPKELEDYKSENNPGYVFATSLTKKEIINPSDISRLIHALEQISLDGIADDVRRSYERNCGKTSLNIEARKKTFIDEIKKTYRDLCNRVQPIPFNTERLLRVNDVFIDSGIEFFCRKGNERSWIKLGSYHRVFDKSLLPSNRFMLLGKPGYGKTTLALQFAYDWCNSCPESPLRNVEILIFLKLRELSGVLSIFRAIENSLLQKDTKLRDNDIEEIFHNSSSIIIVLEGFDNYAHKGGTDDDDVTKIIKGEMFSDFPVLLITTPSCIPSNMSPTTIQLRLTGFDSEAQDMYISKAFGGAENWVNIKSLIEGNPIMRDLCKVPFIFGMVLNLISDEKFPFDLNTVTALFRYIMGSFHEHMKNKLTTEEQEKYGKVEEDHQKLDKIAFNALTGDSEDGVWTKETLQKQIGKELYDTYIAFEILVEEENDGDTTDVPKSATFQHTSTTQTRFYHTLFQEWFAAHYLSEYASRMFAWNFEKTLRKLREKNLKYVFQFACGINPVASSKIVKFLQKSKTCEKLAELCVLEQEYGSKTKDGI